MEEIKSNIEVKIDVFRVSNSSPYLPQNCSVVVTDSHLIEKASESVFPFIESDSFYAELESIRKKMGLKSESQWVVKVPFINSANELDSVFVANIGKVKGDHNFKTTFKHNLQKLGAKLSDYLMPLKIKEISIISVVSSVLDFIPSADVSCYVGYGFLQKSYRFHKYKTNNAQENESDLENESNLSAQEENNSKFKVNILLSNDQDNECESRIKTLTEHLSDELFGVLMCRHLVNEPACSLNPKTYPDFVNKIFKGIKNVEIEVLDADQLKKLGMNMLLGVGIGSDIKPCVIVIKYKGRKEDLSSRCDAVLCGKGVTFDSGGLNIKPSRAMYDMKTDMGGSASVVGGLYAISKRAANANVVGVLGVVENLVNGSAQKPGDIVKSASGKTVEVIDTDAEGRLVLGDIVHYASTKYNPKYCVTTATLTGAVIVALGKLNAGFFTESEKLYEQFFMSAKNSGDFIWRLPLGPDYDRMIDSEIADVKNISGTGEAGSITAAHFVSRFVPKNIEWCHLDIAGVAGARGSKFDLSVGDGTGFGVKLFNHWSSVAIEDE